MKLYYNHTEMTKAEFLQVIKDNCKCKFEIASLLDHVNGIHSNNVLFINSYTKAELKEKFNAMMQEQETKVIETFLNFECYRGIVIIEEETQIQKVSKHVISKGLKLTANNIMIQSLFFTGGTISEAEAKQYIKIIDINTFVEIKTKALKTLQGSKNIPPFIAEAINILKKEIAELKRELNGIKAGSKAAILKQ